MTTSSKRRVIRGSALGLVLSGSIAFAGHVQPRPYGFDSWPHPPVAKGPARLVHVRPDAPMPDAATAGQRAQPAPDRRHAGTERHRRPAASPHAQPKRPAQRPADPAQPPTPTPPSDGGQKGHGGVKGTGQDGTGSPGTDAEQQDPPSKPQDAPDVSVAQTAPAEPLVQAAAKVEARIPVVAAPERDCDEDRDEAGGDRDEGPGRGPEGDESGD